MYYMCVAYFTPHRLQDSQVQDHWWVQKLHWGTATGGHPRMFWSSPQCWHYVSLGRETSLKGCPLLVPHVVFVFTPVLMLHKSWYKNYMEVLLLVGSPECFGLIPPPHSPLLILHQYWYRNCVEGLPHVDTPECFSPLIHPHPTPSHLQC